mmetsp:Transcript_20360/g.28777  ORF Transcript_20360/g.28777 Transcript_20360/m.28777 type:complete len:83 (+) Transcript_20360:961-1209(+)
MVSLSSLTLKTEQSLTQVLIDGFNYPSDAKLDGPSSVAFGSTENDSNRLYITIAAFLIMPPPVDLDRNPSLMAVDLAIPEKD